MFRVLAKLFAELDLLPFDGDRSGQRIFYEIRQARPKQGESFFLNKAMGRKTFDDITNHAVEAAGIDTAPIRLTNQSLRVSSFNVHDLLGHNEGQMATTAGHSSTKTCRVYRRQNEELMASIGGRFQEKVHGEKVTFPDMNIVRCTDGTIRAAKRFLPCVDMNDENVVIINRLPISEELFEIELDLVLGEEEKQVEEERGKENVPPVIGDE